MKYRGFCAGWGIVALLNAGIALATRRRREILPDLHAAGFAPRSTERGRDSRHAGGILTWHGIRRGLS